MTTLQNFNIIGEITIYNNNIIIDANAVGRDGESIVEVESYEADIPEIPPDTHYRVLYAANLAVGGRVFKFLADGKKSILDHPQVDKAIRMILQMFRSKHKTNIENRLA